MAGDLARSKSATLEDGWKLVNISANTVAYLKCQVEAAPRGPYRTPGDRVAPMRAFASEE